MAKKWVKWAAAFSAVLMAVGFTACDSDGGKTPAEDWGRHVYGDYTLVGDGDCYRVVKYEGTEAEVVIPDSYNGMPITKIDTEAFPGNTTMTSVVMPDSIEWLGIGAFAECSKLESVTFSSKLTIISQFAFRDCDVLERVTVPEGITKIAQSAFYNCDKLDRVSLPKSLTHIENNAFDECTALTTVVFSGTADDWAAIEVGSVNASPLRYATLYIDNVEPTDVTITATTIGRYAFYRCSALDDVILADSVETINDQAFASSGIKTLVIGSGVKSIGYAAAKDTELQKVYYHGTEAEWSQITVENTNANILDATRYYYSETEQTNGNYWHYENGVPTAW